jgi:hypothetical protein
LCGIKQTGRKEGSTARAPIGDFYPFQKQVHECAPCSVSVFWRRQKADWPFWSDRSSSHAVPTAAVCCDTEFSRQFISSLPYLLQQK